jgi:site-specific DNA recombinase
MIRRYWRLLQGTGFACAGGLLAAPWHGKVTTAMKALGYARVSTDKQAERGVSLEAQAEKIRAMAVVHGADLLDLIVDGGQSAKSLQRPGIERLLALVDARKVDSVIIAKLDRLTRSVKDLCELLERFERRGVALISVAESLDTSSAAGRLVLNVMTAVSQWEREAIGERTRDALGHKKRNGECVGNIAFGYRLAADGEHVEPDDAEQAAIAAIRGLRANGRTLRQIAADLNQAGRRTRRGSPWRLESVARVVQSTLLIQ